MPILADIQKDTCFWWSDLRDNRPCPVPATSPILRGESAGLAADIMGTLNTTAAEDTVPTLQPDELSAVILFDIEPLA